MGKTFNVPALDNVESIYRKYLVLGEDQFLALTLWTAHSYMFSEQVSPSPSVTPYLYVFSAEAGSGKTTIFDIAEKIARNARSTANITPAAMFRMIESRRPTLLIDEVDAIWSGAKNEDLRGVINSGYTRSGTVTRYDASEKSDVDFTTFCPKALGGIDNAKLPTTIETRSIPINIKKAKADELATIEPFYLEDVEDELIDTAQALGEWVIKNGNRAALYRPERDSSLEPRQNQIMAPLLQIAHLCGAAFEKRARAALTRLLESRTVQETPQRVLLRAVQEAWVKHEATAPKKVADRIFSADLAAAIGWESQKLLAERLRPFGIESQTVRVGNTTGRGYYRKQFTDAFERYL